MKTILFLFLLFSNLLARDYVYFLPKDGEKAQKHIINLITHANNNIKIAIYSFTNKKFAKALKIAAKRGVDIKIIADYESNKNQKYKSVVPILKKLRHIKVHLINGSGRKYKGIMHIKMLIIDDRVVSFGSANYTYSAFNVNYELLYINDDWTFTRKFIKIFNTLWKK